MSILTPHQNAALDFTRHISLTANAGSGKTFVLSKRYLSIALNENIPLRNIAAITFTDKAAGELYKKISKEIDDLTTVTVDPGILRKLERIRRQLVSANISTIHSFCIDILKEFPVEAQLDANFSPIDQPASDELIELAIEETIKELLQDPEGSEQIKSLIRFFSSKSKLASETASLIKNRKNVLETAGFYNSGTEETAAFFYNSFLKTVEDILLPGLNSFIENVSVINSRVLETKKDNTFAVQIRFLLEQLKTENNTEALLKLLWLVKEELCLSEGQIKNRGYLTRDSREDIPEVIAAAESYIKALKYFKLTDDHHQIEIALATAGKNILDFFHKCLDKYEAKKKENGWLDYEDLLLFTMRILENEQVRLSLSDKFKYIMIDEYQDTNEIQYRIFLPILDHLKKNNLFVVGDEKQSIYMFRDAELEVFNRTKQDIVTSSGETSELKLPDSFRMAPVLCLFTNYLFRNLFSAPQIPFNEVGHTDIVCARKVSVDGKVEILITEKDDNETSESELISLRLLKLVFGDEQPLNYKWGDIAILCRKRKHFQELEKSFVKYNIPFSILGGKGFYQRQSVYDVYNYFAFLLDTSNDAALAGILRSPFFNISDAVLYEISLQSGYSFWQKVKNYSEQDPSFSKLTGLIEENLLLSRNYNLTSLLRKILNESGYHAVLSAGSNGEQETANMNKLIKLTIKFFSQGYKTLYDYVNFLKDSIESEEDEAQASVSDESDSVKILTIHQSKGLEFPIVVIYRSADVSQNNTVKTKEIIVDKKFGLLTKVPLNDDYFLPYSEAPILHAANYISSKKNLAEIKRLFYVAVTRAMDILIISVESSTNYKKDSFAGLLSEGFENDLSGSEYEISSTLSFLKLNDDSSYTTSDKKLSAVIPIIREINDEVIRTDIDEKELVEYTSDLNIIEDSQKGEIISATKYSVFRQCPVKYNLIYEYGFSELFEFGRKVKSGSKFINDDTDNESPEENIPGRKFGDVKGRIIHRILQKEINPSELETEGDKIIDGELIELNIPLRDEKILRETVKEDLSSYYKSDVYKYLKDFPEFNNEFNLYTAEKDYFLFGIIDKLIFSEQQAIIIDYKTDDITEKEIAERSELYFNQLKFYSYIIKSAFKKVMEIKLILVFLKYPDKDISLVLNSAQIEQTGTDISRMVTQIRQKNYSKNLDHCRSCHFFINKNCIII